MEFLPFAGKTNVMPNLSNLSNIPTRNVYLHKATPKVYFLKTLKFTSYSYLVLSRQNIFRGKSDEAFRPGQGTLQRSFLLANSLSVVLKVPFAKNDDSNLVEHRAQSPDCTRSGVKN